MTEMSLNLASLQSAYRSGALTPRALVDHLLDRIEAEGGEHNVWITPLSRERMLTYASALEGRDRQRLPLYGVPFAIKDNIDLAGVPTTAACPDYGYTPEVSAPVVQRLIEAGAIPVGKTNLDQFATGLVGARSPYGPGRNAFDPDYISGGSSSGSAVAVALGLVSFALGTDTAGSGRVPAAFNNLVGLKPTRGLLSTGGVVPACRSLDCVSVFALTAADAGAVLDTAAVFDADDPFSRPFQPPALGRPLGGVEGLRLGVPLRDQLAFFGDEEYAALFDQSVAALRALGAEVVELDCSALLESARLLYEGPWLAERWAAVGEFVRSDPDALFPVTRGIIEKGRDIDAAAAFRGQYRLAELRRQADALWRSVDAIVTPTAGTVYTVAQVEADPVTLNSNLGYYTNFMNLLDLAAVAAPGGFRRDGLPFGVTLFAPAFHDRGLLRIADVLQRERSPALGATGAPLPDTTPGGDAEGVRLAVCGAHLDGLALNHQLRERGARRVEATSTAPLYRLYALPGDAPKRAGLVRVEEGGAALEVEVWELPAERLAEFVAGIPSPLGIGRVYLADGRDTLGFLCEAAGVSGAEDVTAHGGWRAYLQAAQPA